MMLGARMLLTILGVSLFVSFSRAITPENPYHTILDRNPFGLNPPVVVTPTNTTEPPRNVKFNGITNAGGRKKAFFTIPGKEPKDPLQYVTLSEGEKTDILELSKISEDEAEVEVVNSGIKMVLNFKNNGNKGATLAPQPGAPPGPPMPVPQPQTAPNPGAAVFNPNAVNPAVAQPVGEAGLVPQPTNPNGTQANPQGQPGAPEAPLNRIPTRTLRLNPVTPP
ncbi:MAG: hypothetical protein JWM68_1135 [Verrucomicrobiales bacterium]|nr:hypothetical protein [Verrucomicrobiales bacterium]